MERVCDFIVIGAGIAAASAGYSLARHGHVMLLERESQPGYHSTGRSAALYMRGYGPEQVRALTIASWPFLNTPPAGFSDHPLLSRRGALLVARGDEEESLQDEFDKLRAIGSSARILTARETCEMVPVLRPEKVVGGLFDPDAADIDVHALHDGFLRGIRRAGGSVACGAHVTRLEFRDGLWSARAGDDVYRAPVVLNAAGAWADQVARLAGIEPIGLQPLRRSAFTFAPPKGLDTQGWPLVMSLGHDWYFKPDAGMLLGSPANEDLVEPQDVQAEEFDIALGVYRIEEATTLSIGRLTSTWAGLRSFVPDRGLVAGFDAGAPGFFWVAGQGGYGIQTCAAMGEACGALARGLPLPGHLGDHGLTAQMLGPERLGRAIAPASRRGAIRSP